MRRTTQTCSPFIGINKNSLAISFEGPSFVGAHYFTRLLRKSSGFSDLLQVFSLRVFNAHAASAARLLRQWEQRATDSQTLFVFSPSYLDHLALEVFSSRMTIEAAAQEARRQFLDDLAFVVSVLPPKTKNTALFADTFAGILHDICCELRQITNARASLDFRFVHIPSTEEDALQILDELADDVFTLLAYYSV